MANILGGFGEDFGKDFFVALPAVSLPKNPQKKIRVKIRTEIRTQKIPNPHENPHAKSA